MEVAIEIEPTQSSKFPRNPPLKVTSPPPRDGASLGNGDKDETRSIESNLSATTKFSPILLPSWAHRQLLEVLPLTSLRKTPRNIILKRSDSKMGQHYKEIAEIALKRREAALPKEYLLPEAALTDLPQNLTTVPRSSGHFTTAELEIIESNAEDILLKIKERKWTSLEVTKAFYKSAVVAQQLVRY